MKKILHVFDIEVPKDKVFAALTTQQGLSGWWTTDVSAENKVGGKIQFRFSDEFNPQMQVTRLEQDQAVDWKCVAGHDNWLSNTFSFRLADRGPQTHVTFAQDYARELSDDDYGSYNFNWGYFMESLKLYCETGEGKPYSASA